MSGLRSCLPFDIAILWMLLDATLAVNLGVAALLSMVLADGGHFGTRVLGGYLLAFAVLILLLVVTMPPWVLTYVPFMLSYIGKGNLYIFMGLVALPDKVGNYRCGPKDSDHLVVSCWMLVGVGCAYFLAALLEVVLGGGFSALSYVHFRCLLPVRSTGGVGGGPGSKTHNFAYSSQEGSAAGTGSAKATANPIASP